MTDPLFTVQNDLPVLVWSILAGVPSLGVRGLSSLHVGSVAGEEG